MTISGARKYEHKFLARSTDNLRLFEENTMLKKENSALENLPSSLKAQNDLLQEKVNHQEEIIKKDARKDGFR